MMRVVAIDEASFPKKKRTAV
jgi:hypothetical protein